MKPDLNKTKIMVYRNGGILQQTEKWFYPGIEIEFVSIYKYLGVYFTPKLSWTKTKEVLAMQAQKAASSVFRFQKQFGFFCPPEVFKLFDSMVKPVAIYGAEIWEYTFSEEIEKIQTKFCKQYVGLKKEKEKKNSRYFCTWGMRSISFSCRLYDSMCQILDKINTNAK